MKGDRTRSNGASDLISSMLTITGRFNLEQSDHVCTVVNSSASAFQGNTFIGERLRSAVFAKFFAKSPISSFWYLLKTSNYNKENDASF